MRSRPLRSRETGSPSRERGITITFQPPVERLRLSSWASLGARNALAPDSSVMRRVLATARASRSSVALRSALRDRMSNAA